MRHSNWQLRAFALLQLILALPPMVSGSICFSTDGSVGPEFGPCVCTVSFAGTTAATFGTTDAADCGACRDEELSAMWSARQAAPHAPMASIIRTALCLAVTARPVPGTRLVSLSHPPGERLSILRC